MDDNQLTADDLDTMTNAEIATARRQGRLNRLLGQPVRPVTSDDQQLGFDDLHLMTRSEVHAALRRGQFAELLRGRN